MIRVPLQQVKLRKYFYRDNFRRALNGLIVSFGVCFFLLASILFILKNRAEVEFYSTNGITAPMSLDRLDEANTLSEPLLEADQDEEMSIKSLDLDEIDND